MMETEPRASEIYFSDHDLILRLVDDRVISTPLAWFPKLLHATPLERMNWRLLGDGIGIHWSELDEDISVEELVFGVKPR